jgi:hypothetical protein
MIQAQQQTLPNETNFKKNNTVVDTKINAAKLYNIQSRY